MTKKELQEITKDSKIMTKQLKQKLYNMGGEYIAGYSKNLPYGSKDISEFKYNGKKYIGIGLYVKQVQCQNGYYANMRQCIAFEQ